MTNFTKIQFPNLIIKCIGFTYILVITSIGTLWTDQAQASLSIVQAVKSLYHELDVSRADSLMIIHSNLEIYTKQAKTFQKTLASSIDSKAKSKLLIQQLNSAQQMLERQKASLSNIVYQNFTEHLWNAREMVVQNKNKELDAQVTSLLKMLNKMDSWVVSLMSKN